MKKAANKVALCVLLASGVIRAQMSSAEQKDSSTIAPDGTAYITRVVPVPKTVSPEAQKLLSTAMSDAAVPQTLEQRRQQTTAWQEATGEMLRKQFSVEVKPGTVAGIPVREILPQDVPNERKDWVLINLHGGGFNSDSGSLIETVPVAALAKARVVAVLYRLSPENKFPAAVEDAVAVYRETLKTHKPSEVVIFGTSAGAVLTAQVAVKLKQLGLPQPAALGIFSGSGDMSKLGDSIAMYALNGLSGHLDPPQPPPVDMKYLIGTMDPQDPVLSPVYADLHGLPPTLFITSGRDLLLSSTTILHRAYLHAGVDARLVVFEALPHAFWVWPQLPETHEANEMMANFFVAHLQRH